MIKESFVQNRRVLAVLSMYRKVKGSILGSSKQEGIAYIEPETIKIFS
jgi:DNA mismatch repair protein MutS2